MQSLAGSSIVAAAPDVKSEFSRPRDPAGEHLIGLAYGIANRCKVGDTSSYRHYRPRRGVGRLEDGRALDYPENVL
jgi:hypothetical protein